MDPQKEMAEMHSATVADFLVDDREVAKMRDEFITLESLPEVHAQDVHPMSDLPPQTLPPERFSVYQLTCGLWP